MADFEAKPVEKPTNKKKKRKLRSPEEKQRAFKTPRIDHSEEEKEPKEAVEEEKAEQIEENQKLEEGRPWRNLQLILSIQNKDLDLQMKVQLAFDYVKSRVNEEDGDTGLGRETVSVSRLIVFLNDWIQSILISLEKKTRVEGEKPRSKVIGTCLDFRCWEVFKFCLVESLKMHVSLNFSRNLLRAIGCIASNALSPLNEASLGSKESFFVGEGFELYSIVPDCVSLVFSSHGGVLNENLDLWVSTVGAVLELVQKIYSDNLDTGNAGVFVLRFSCLVLEPFSKFLRVHPCRKSGFHDFIDKLLEPLLHLLGVLHLQIDGSNPGWTRNLLKLVEEVLSQGLFHPSHIDGFLGLHSTEKYVASHEGKSKDAKTVIKSYHRHLFDKLEKIMAGKKVLVLGGIGDLFRLLVGRVKKQKGTSVLSGGTQMIGKRGGSRHLENDFSGHMSKMLSGNNSGLSEKSYCSSSFNAETRKSLFDFFVLIMEPLLLEINSYLQTKLEVGPVLLDVHCTFKSINNILASFMHEKVYVRTEDNSEGACLNFLKKVYDMITSFSIKINKVWLSSCGDKGTHMEISNLIVKELILAVGYFLEIEYEVIGSDLVSLWLMMLSYLATSLSSMGAPDQCLLTSKILDLGCQLVKLYSELRQVTNIIFALCKAVRLLVLHDNDGEMNCSRFMSWSTSLSYEAYAKSVGMLICSQEFRFVICNAIKSIPEGQASGCIRQLTMDISESLEWMKESSSVTAGKEFEKLDLRSGSMTCFDLQAEVLGRGLSELYTLVLDSLTVTTGNSNLVGVSIKDLMTVIQPSMSSLVGLHPDSVNEFLLFVTGRTFDNKVAGCKNDLLKLGGSTHWVFLFFFRLYMSCRSLYRQAICLVPPDSSRKLLAVMGDSFTAYSGRDWMERTNWTDMGYFSWIVQRPASLLIIIQSVSDIYLQDSVADCSPLIYVLHAMALQRLVDLNRQIKSLEYLLQRNENLVQNKLIDAAGLSMYRKQSRKWERCNSVLRQEAGGLTDFMMEFLSLVAKKQQPTSSFDDATYKDICAQALHENDAWDLGVSAVNEKSLPTAIWWIVCQNTDMWCTYAAKKKLKMFLSLLICNSLPCIRSSLGEVGKHNINEPGHLRKVTVQQISLQLLRDTILYEQRFVCRNLASTFCHILEKSALSLFSDSSYGDFDFSSSPNWPEVLSELDKKSLVVVSGNKHVMYDCSSVAEPISHLSNEVFPLTSMEFTACQSLLNLLCWMPKGYSNSRSFSLYATYILNLERHLVGSLLNCHGALYSHDHYELFRMFVSCRRALKYLIMAYCEEKMEASQSSLISILPEGSFLVLWLLKSVSAVVGLQHAFSEDSAKQVKHMLFSLMDHTSYVFLTLSKDQFRLAVDFLASAEKPSKKQLNSDVAHEQSNLNELDPCLDSSKDIDAWESVVLVAETLKEQTNSLLISLKDAFRNEKMGVGVSVVDLNKFSSMVSCFQGFLWGVASAVNDIDAKNCNVQPKILRWKREPISRLNLCIDVFTDFIDLFLRVLLFEDDQRPESICDVQSLLKSDYCDDSLGVEEFSLKVSGSKSDISCGKHRHKSGAARNSSASADIEDDSGNTSVWRKRLQSADADCAASVLAEIDSFDLQCLNKPLLRNLLNGNNPEAAFSLRQLFIACSALLRLNLQINYTPLSTSLVPIFVGISQVLLLELEDMVEVPQPFSFVWLDGVLKYLEELGSHFPLTNPTLSRNVYAKLIDLHLRAIGKCISLQGKRATLASHETESSTKTLDGHIGLPEAGPYCLNEFKGRLRMSFRVFISKPSELHLLSAIQALERALVGVQEGCTMIYEINTGGADGGKVSSIVAAGIDCLDLVLEFVAGRKRLNVVKRHIQSLIAGLFNIILHLQSPLIFYGKLIHNKGDTGPDPGSIILMCVEVLTRVSGKHALFQMDSCHVVQSLRIPAALFQDFHQLRLSKDLAPSISLMISDNQDCDPVASTCSCVVDRRFSIDLFAACCRLLYTILKHHKSECEQCVALLEDSVCVLLHCLETVNADSVVRKGSFAWEVQEGVKCACFLRRIYEEIRHQKDVFGRHCFQFLSSYIWIYSGHGPLKTGIRREIDEALRPGVYALIDACSADDLQHLHTVFGEGPCRSTLATLQHDYKLNFQYEGKV